IEPHETILLQGLDDLIDPIVAEAGLLGRFLQIELKATDAVRAWPRKKIGANQPNLGRPASRGPLFPDQIAPFVLHRSSVAFEACEFVDEIEPPPPLPRAN